MLSEDEILKQIAFLVFYSKTYQQSRITNDVFYRIICLCGVLERSNDAFMFLNGKPNRSWTAEALALYRKYKAEFERDDAG